MKSMLSIGLLIGGASLLCAGDSYGTAPDDLTEQLEIQYEAERNDDMKNADRLTPGVLMKGQKNYDSLSTIIKKLCSPIK